MQFASVCISRSFLQKDSGFLISQCMGTIVGSGLGKFKIISKDFFGLAVKAPLIGIANISTDEVGKSSNETASPQCANVKPLVSI